MVGLIGTKEFASKVKDLIREYLTNNLKLSLSEEKTKITHLGKDRANFLGMRF